VTIWNKMMRYATKAKLTMISQRKSRKLFTGVLLWNVPVLVGGPDAVVGGTPRGGSVAVLNPFGGDVKPAETAL
jgi:hypothetical protein